MAWNDYIYDFENGNKFESNRFQVIFDLTDERPHISEVEYSQNIPNYSSYTFDIESIATPLTDYYMIGWFEVTPGDEENATGRGLNDIYNISSPPLTLPTIDYSDITNCGIYPISETNPKRTPFELPTQQIERHVSCNFPIIAVCNSNIEYPNYDIMIARTAMYNYAVTGDWNTYIKPWLEVGAFINMNYQEAPTEEPEGTEYRIYNTGQRGTWSLGNVVSNVSTPYYRWAKLKLKTTSSNPGRLAFYRVGLDNGIIKLLPKFGSNIVYCKYSTDGGVNWEDTLTFPYDYIYGERINELGTFIYATREGLNVPIFETESEANDWVNNDPDADITDAINYDDIAEDYPIVNPTGDPETGTTMGDGSNFKNHFTTEYICSETAINNIKGALFDTQPGGIWEDIKKGLDMFGSNPIDAVCGLLWSPIDLSTVLTGLGSDQNYIYFGGYQYILTAGNVKEVLNHSGYIDLGTFTIEDAFPNPKDYRNFEPYCKLKIFLPFIGIQDLSYNKYRGKTVKVRYYVDTTNGSCICCLFADDVLYDFFNGQMLVQVPISLTDFAGYAQAQLRNLSNLAGVGVNMAGVASGNIAAALPAIANFETGMNDLAKTSPDQFNITKGGSGPVGNACYLPQYVYLIFEYIKTDETKNLRQLEGRRTNKSGTLQNFSGYLSIDSIELQTTAAMSESEKTEFISLLQSGIFI